MSHIDRRLFVRIFNRVDTPTIVYDVILFVCLLGLVLTVWGQMTQIHQQAEQIERLDRVLGAQQNWLITAEQDRKLAAEDRKSFRDTARTRNKLGIAIATAVGVSPKVLEEIIKGDPYER